MKSKFYVDLFDQVSQLNLNDRYRVNSGGCGCFAKVMLKYLPELKIIYLTDDEYDKDKFDNGNPASCNHIVLSDGRFHYDANGAHSKTSVKPHCIHRFEVDEEFLDESLDVSYLWNNWFERENLDYIEREVFTVIQNNRKEA